MSATPYYSDDLVAVHHGDALEALQGMSDESVDAVVTDPPYGLEFMGKEWDSFRPSSARIRTRPDGRTNPTNGKSVTATPEAYVAGPPFQAWCHAWATECLRVLKPGGHLLAFGGTRTWHRLVCAIEDAGFEIRDSITWMYASGFPKSLDVSKAIDKTGGQSPALSARVLRDARERAGLTREQVAQAVGCKASSIANWEDGRSRAAGRAVEFITPSAAYRSKLADLLGYTADERVIAGTDDDRRGDETVYGLGHSGVRYSGGATTAGKAWSGWGTALKPAHEPICVARKPMQGTVAATVLAHGTGALNVGGCRIPGEPVVTLDRVAGDRARDQYRTGTGENRRTADSGRWPTNVILSHAGSDEVGDLCADGCVPGCPVAELDKQSGTLTSGVLAPHHNAKASTNASMSGPNQEGRVKNTFGGDSGGASRFFPAFRYEAKAGSAERPQVDGVAHPTVKPLALIQWLARLVTPPGGLVLDPFAGSGTTAEACALEGLRCIAVEKEAAYLPLILARLSKPCQLGLDFFGDAA